MLDLINKLVVELYQVAFILSCIVLFYALLDTVLFAVSSYSMDGDYEPKSRNNWVIIWLSLGIFISYLI
ncbi:MAG: hypothetical protein ACOCVF_00160 [bacterium]